MIRRIGVFGVCAHTFLTYIKNKAEKRIKHEKEFESIDNLSNFAVSKGNKDSLKEFNPREKVFP